MEGKRTNTSNNNEQGGKAPMEMMSEFLTFVSVETLTEQTARRALSISSAILRIEPKNQLIREYQKTLNEYIEHKKSEAKNESEEEEEDEDEDEDDEGEDDDEIGDGDEKEGEGKYESKR